MEDVSRVQKTYLALAVVAFSLLFFQSKLLNLVSRSATQMRYAVDALKNYTTENHILDKVHYKMKILNMRKRRPSKMIYNTEKFTKNDETSTSSRPDLYLQERNSITHGSLKDGTQTSSTLKHKDVFKENRNNTILARCPEESSNLVGKVTIDLNSTLDVKDVEKELIDKPVGGRWKPQTCMARDRVAIVIPFRDRHRHLVLLLKYLIPMLQRQLLDFWIFVPEQLGNGTFNKGRLMNAGAKEAMAMYDFRCIIFHDVDLIPEDDRNMYSCKHQPFHLSISIDKWKYLYMYDLLVGGVLNLRRDHLLAVNGYSNKYWGWGAEDDDMAYRILASNFSILRPPGILGRYKSIPHYKRFATAREGTNNYNLLKAAKRYKISKLREYLRDGLNNVPYKLVKKTEFPLFTHFLIDVGTA